MAALVVTQNVTLDGVIEAVDDWFEPTGDTSDVLAVVQRQMAAETAFLVGRSTFEDLRGFWPNQTDDETGITAHLNRVDKYVISSTLTDPGWANSRVLSGDLVQEVIDLKANTRGTVGVTGSISVVHQLITAGLVDEFRLFVYPRVLGRGRRLFPEGFDLALRLESGQAFDSGVVLAIHRRA